MTSEGLVCSPVHDSLWGGGGEEGADLDNRILDADAPFRFDRITSYVTAMRVAVQEKKKKCLKRCEEMAGSFAPLVCTLDRFFHQEFVAFMKKVAATLAGRWGKSKGRCLQVA
eukprot:CAMPEP_0206391910 /NCGR_PEP_ID=MMETSP0294-20121207/19613_1 /ASSEMBLY_ACC=CAM_ASM_000327 /TAXON_ID=39354 /ORGANISM="Heterosigma akashiwo, Strain CCMP2393" /LENGTH=112 /DNA_ID=CAMNT_0053844825 /DNA_START=246 /DNA_END=585 /DNA_ORIENTATION=+